jgi:hypothetical protein
MTDYMLKVSEEAEDLRARIEALTADNERLRKASRLLCAAPSPTARAHLAAIHVHLQAPGEPGENTVEWARALIEESERALDGQVELMEVCDHERSKRVQAVRRARAMSTRAARLRKANTSTLPRACRIFQPWSVPTDEAGSSVDPASCFVCGMMAADHGWASGDGADVAKKLASPQPPPRRGHENVMPEVIELLQKRAAVGLEKYGTELQTYNGRDAPLDKVHELADALCYAVQDWLERRQLRDDLVSAVARAGVAALAIDDVGLNAALDHLAALVRKL